MTTPPDGTVYLATDNRWYRWPDPTPYPTQEAAERGVAFVVPATQSPPAPPVAEHPFYAAAGPPSDVSRATMYVGAVLIGLPVLVGAVAMLTRPDHHPPGGGCEGIGFGCTPSPRSAAFFATVFSILIAAPATGVAWLLMWMADRNSATFHEWPPVLKAGAVLAAYAAFGLVLLMARAAGSS